MFCGNESAIAAQKVITWIRNPFLLPTRRGDFTLGSRAEEKVKFQLKFRSNDIMLQKKIYDGIFSVDG